ncbi:MAG: hypothetical protein R3F61_17880 [Myxococcota bacterium]
MLWISLAFAEPSSLPVPPNRMESHLSARPEIPEGYELRRPGAFWKGAGLATGGVAAIGVGAALAAFASHEIRSNPGAVDVEPYVGSAAIGGRASLVVGGILTVWGIGRMVPNARKELVLAPVSVAVGPGSVGVSGVF